MKIRQGFVSNSSSSSFIAIGAIIPRNKISQLTFCKTMGFVKSDCTDEDLEEQIEDVDPDSGRNYYDFLNECFIDSGESGAPKGKTIIGKVITIDEETQEILSLDKILNEVKNILSKNNLSDESIQIIIGSKMT